MATESLFTLATVYKNQKTKVTFPKLEFLPYARIYSFDIKFGIDKAYAGSYADNDDPGNAFIKQLAMYVKIKNLQLKYLIFKYYIQL